MLQALASKNEEDSAYYEQIRYTYNKLIVLNEDIFNQR